MSHSLSQKDSHVNERRKIEDRLRRKEQEIAQFEAQINEARIYIQALQDVLKLLPRDKESEDGAETILRPGSAVARARAAILRRGAPLHLSELLRDIGLRVTPETRASLGGSLAAYVRRGEIFSRPAPNTFGLTELEHRPDTGTREPPENFGAFGPPSTEEGGAF
jgi:hypothetical protein